jgi:anti-sigma B factor antagonist
VTASQPDGPALEPTPLSIRIDDPEDGRVRTRLTGELDLATVPELKAVLHEQLSAGHDVVLDLSMLDFVDSSGLQGILIALKEAASLPGTLSISSAIPPQVHRLLEIAGVLPSLPLVDV